VHPVPRGRRHRFLLDIMLNFQGDHARQLLRRERAHGQPLRVRIKRVIGRSRSIGIHQNCGRLNALVARSYYDGLLLGEYPGPSGPITLVNFTNATVHTFPFSKLLTAFGVRSQKNGSRTMCCRASRTRIS
jgi:hypothetical protein